MQSLFSLTKLPGFLFKRVAYEVAGRSEKARAAAQLQAADREILEKLCRDGIAVVPNFLSPRECARILEDYEPLLDKISKGEQPAGKKIKGFPSYGVFRLLEAEKESRLAARSFFSSEKVAAFARSYVGAYASAYQKMIEIKPCPGLASKADRPHIDDWRHRFKAFLYLTNVREDNAPLVYWLGSHRVAAWRLKKEFSYYCCKDENSGYLTEDEVDKIADGSWFERRCVTADAGTLLLVDTRG